MSEAGGTAGQGSQPATPLAPGTPARSRQGSTASQKPPATPLAKASDAGSAAPAAAPESAGGRSRGPSMASMTQMSRQGSQTSAAPVAAAAAATPAEGSMQGDAAVLSRRGSQQSVPVTRQPSSQAAPAPRSPLEAPPSTGRQESAAPLSPPQDDVLDQQAFPDVASAPSEPAAPPPPTPPAAAPLSTEERLQQAEAELAEAQAQIRSLEQTNEAVRRHMSSTSSDGKVKILTQDLSKKCDRIKTLEAEVKKQTARADTAEKKLRELQNKEKRASRSPLDKSSAQDKAVIKELQGRLEEAESRLHQQQQQQPPQYVMPGAPAPSPSPSPSPSPAPEDHGVMLRFQQQLAERDAEITRLRSRLDRAQEAIVSSAGAGFENEVKLQQARSALQCILSSQSPTSRAARSRSPQSALPKYDSLQSSGARAYYDTLGLQRLSSASPSYSPLGSVQPRTVSPTRQRYGSPKLY